MQTEQDLMAVAERGIVEGRTQISLLLRSLLQQLEPLEHDFQGQTAEVFKTTCRAAAKTVHDINKDLDMLANGIKQSGALSNTTDEQSSQELNKIMAGSPLADQM